MMCEKCLERPASVYLTKIINGNKTQIKLCSYCANETNEFGFGSDFNLSLQDFLSGMMKFEPDQIHKCPKCGLEYRRFNKEGRLGCTKCYETFQQKLDPLLKRIHGSTLHSGKIPKRSGGKIKTLKTIKGLKEQLRLAIETEEFERAAELRDQIKELQNSSLGGDS